MIELFTAAAMLVSTLYGPVAAQASTSPIADLTASTTSAYVASSTTVASSTDSIKDVKAFIKSYYAGDPLLIDIARCESTFRQYDKTGNILRGKVNSADIGVMQINEAYHLDKAESMGLDIRTVEGNAAYAKYLYDTQGVAPWSASEKCWNKPIAMK